MLQTRTNINEYFYHTTLFLIILSCCHTSCTDFSAFWNWKGDDRSSDGGDSEKGIAMTKSTLIKSQVEREMEDYLGHVKIKSPATKQQEKVERLQQLKQLYFTERTTTTTTNGNDEQENGNQPLITSANYRGPADRVGVLDTLRKRLADQQDQGVSYLSKSIGIAERGSRQHHGSIADQGGGSVSSLAHGRGSNSIRPIDNHSSIAHAAASGIRTLDQPLTNHDMASVYKYFMTDELDSGSRPSSTVNDVLPYSHKTISSSHQNYKGSEMMTSGGSSKQLLLPPMTSYQQQQQQQQQRPQNLTNDSPLMLQPSPSSSTRHLHQHGDPNSLSPTSLSPNSDEKTLSFSQKSSETIPQGTSASRGEMGMILHMDERPYSPLTSRTTNNNVDVLLDWTRSLDVDMF